MTPDRWSYATTTSESEAEVGGDQSESSKTRPVDLSLGPPPYHTSDQSYLQKLRQIPPLEVRSLRQKLFSSD